jgi:hypothetical protein
MGVVLIVLFCVKEFNPHNAFKSLKQNRNVIIFNNQTQKALIVQHYEQDGCFGIFFSFCTGFLLFTVN